MRRVGWAVVVVVTLALGAGCGGSGGRAKRPRATTSTTVATTTAPSSTTTTVPLLPEQWQPLPDAPVFLGRYNVWTGTEFIGGTAGCCDGLGTNDVVAYSPATHSWRTLAPFPLPVRSEAVAVWTGREMVVAGGIQAASATDMSVSNAVPAPTGAALDPATNRWRPIASMPAPVSNPDGVVWTGHEVVVLDGSHVFRYDPAADRWSRGATAPQHGRGSVVLWTGTEILVWGGTDRIDYLLPDPMVVHADGVAYNPVTDAWRAIPAAPVPPRAFARGVWTGTEMIIWGGEGAGGSQATGDRGYLGKGAAYDPATNTWRALPASPLAARASHFMVWTGREAIVWGGLHKGGELRDGAAYDPVANTWRKLPGAPPTKVSSATAVWTGQWMLLVGGWKTDLQAVGPSGMAYAPGR